MSSDEELFDQSIHDMVENMREEVALSGSLEGVAKSIFRSQMKDAFKYIGGPSDYWKAVEECWRSATGGDPIPTKYRTNKSVILKAWREDHNVEHWSKDGDVIGKSAIQNTFSMGVALTAESGLRKIIRIIDKVREDSGGTEHEALVEGIRYHLGEPE